MICDSETIPPKEDTTQAVTTAEPVTNVESTETTPVVAIAEQTHVETTPETDAQTASTTSSATTTTTNSNRRFNIHFQQKTKYIRDMWSQQRARINKDYSQFIIILFMCVIAIISCIAALTTNNWICDPSMNQYFGLWNTCYWSSSIKSDVFMINPIENNNTLSNQTVQWEPKRGMWCAKQDLWNVKVEMAEQWRIDQVYASQGLIICGIIMYIVSVVCIVLAWKFMKINNMNYVRNTMITSLFVQIIAFLLLLIGFFLFIFTDRLSTSIILLFVYFAFAIFVTNVVNFITIEYKSYKIRQVGI